MIEYYFIRQRIGRKYTYAVYKGDRRTFCKYVCGFPCEKAAAAYCRTKNAEECRKSFITTNKYHYV